MQLKYLRDELLILTDDPVYKEAFHAGNYVRCALCLARGWEDELSHEKDCPLYSDLVAGVTVSLDLDPLLICPRCGGACEVRHWVAQDESSVICCGGTGRKPTAEEKCSTCCGRGFIAHWYSETDLRKIPCNICSGTGRKKK